MLLVITWLTALGSAAFAWLLAFAGGMRAAPSFARRERLVAGAPALLPLALALWVATSPEHGLGSALGPLLLVGFTAFVVGAPITRRGASHRAVTRDIVRTADGTQQYRDSAHNRALTVAECERALAQEAAGASPPPGTASWAAHWLAYEDGLRRWQQNPEHHVGIVRRLRAAAAQSASPNARQ